jgi:hypothetical protein
MIARDRDKSVVEAFIKSISAIRDASTDQSEKTGSIWAIEKITSSDMDSMESTLKSVRDYLFHHKGPLYDSFDQREELNKLRSTCLEKSKEAINYYIKRRRS